MGFFNSTTWKADGPKPTGLPRCGECGLSKQCFSPKMEPTGEGRKNILFVGEAPGENEDRQGIQLIGDAGQLTRNSLFSIGEDLDEATKTNAVICRPPDNNMSDTYIEACRPNLIKTIKKLKPNVIVLLGGSAVQSLLSTEWKKSIGPIGRWVGWAIPSTTYGCWICPTYHPSYINRMKKDPVLMKMFKKHLEQAYRLEKKPVKYADLDELKKKVNVIMKPREARLYMRDLAKKKGILAFDYEGTGLKPEAKNQEIVSVSFCLDGVDTAAMMIDQSLHKYLSKVLRNPDLKKVASNLKFEERWTIVKLGHPVAGWHWDTMMAAHIIDNRPKICSVKFQSFIHFGIQDYDSHIFPYFVTKDKNGLNKIKDLDPEELLIYNGLDSLLEYMVMERQKEILDV